MSEVARRLERLQAMRARPDRAAAIGGIVAAAADRAARAHKRLGQLVDLWEAVIPATLASRTRLTSVRGGTAHVTAESSAIAFELDRALRAGAEQELRRRFRGTLIRVKVTVGPIEDESGSR